MEYYPVTKKDQILAFMTTGMALEDTILSEINPMEKEKNCIISLICRL